MTLNILSIYKKITADYKSPQLPPPAPNPVLSKKLSELIPQVIEKYKNLPHWGKRIDNGRIKLQPLNNYEADVMLNANSESDLASLPVSARLTLPFTAPVTIPVPVASPASPSASPVSLFKVPETSF